MNRKKLIISLLPLFIFGCSGSGGSLSSSSPKQILPLHLGNSFISRKDYFDFKTGVHYLTKIDTLKITGVKMINADTVYLTNTNQYVADKADGYWIKNAAIAKDEMILEAKYPGAIGDAYLSYTKITTERPPDTVTANWVIVSKDEKVTVPAGTFSCWKYERNAIGTSGRLHLRNFEWWSPGYGLIKREDYYPNETGVLFLIGREELLKEELK